MVEPSDIAGVKPSFVVYDFSRQVGAFVISAHDRRSPDQNFALSRNADLRARQRTAHGSDPVVFESIDGHHWTRLGQAVTLKHRDA